MLLVFDSVMACACKQREGLAKVIETCLRPKSLGEPDHWVIVGTMFGGNVASTGRWLLNLCLKCNMDSQWSTVC